MLFWRLSFAALLTINCLGAALEWPEFRGPTMQGISEATNVPSTWSASSNVAWKIPMHEGWSSPVVSKGKIYLTGATNIANAVSLRAICLDYATGKID